MTTTQKPSFENGLISEIQNKYVVTCDTDAYKLSHHPQYAENADAMISYIESRGGKYDRVLFFGLQLILKEYFLRPLTHEQVDNIIKWETEHMMGNITDDLEIALRTVVDEYDGKLPVLIKAVPEGTIVPVKNVLMTIETSVPDRRIFSLVSYFETKLLRLWSPTTVATTSYHLRQQILEKLKITSVDPMAGIAFMLHDFGSRGASSFETAAFAGAGHLVSFMGSDTTVAIMAAELGYGEPMAAFSIPASEHSTTTSRGVDGEESLVQAMFDNYAKPGAIFATVADSYDVLRFIREITPKFKSRLIESGATWVIRPDSGDPVEMPIKCVIELEKIFGSTRNKKGYKVLNNVKVIQGDGIGPEEVSKIMERLIEQGYCVSNCAFGLGGSLLQKNNRDTQKFSLKCSAIRVNGKWLEVYKNPAVYDKDWNKVEGAESFKKSKRGQLELVRNVNTNEFITVEINEGSPVQLNVTHPWEVMLEPVFKDGELLRDMVLAEVRRNAGIL